MSKNYNIPQPDPNGPQYPYRIEENMSPAEIQKVRDAIAVVMAESDDMLVSIAMRWFRSYKRHELDDIISEMVLYALKYTLPGYDATEGTKVSTYLYGGYTYGASLAYGNRKRQYAKNANVKAATIDKQRNRTSYSDTDYVYDMADELIAHPEKYFNGSTAKYLRDFHSDAIKCELRDYGVSSTISRARRDIHALVSGMSVEPGEDLSNYYSDKHKKHLEALKMLEMYDGGMTFKQIAEAKGWSKDTVRTRIRKAQTNSKSPTP